MRSGSDGVHELSNKVAIVGIGDTDYGADYRSASDSEPDRGHALGLARLALDRAISDAGVDRRDIDGVSFSLMHTQDDIRSICKTVGLKPQFVANDRRIMDDVLPPAVHALVEGRCNTIALVYSAISRSLRRVYGGSAVGAGSPISYHYYHPWGWSSQAAHAALAFQYYTNRYGYTEEDLASVALTLRRHAHLNERAIMREPLDLESYMKARYIVRPLRLLDLCLVNDGAVCLILQRADAAADRPSPAVAVSGWGRQPAPSTGMHSIVIEPSRPYLTEAAHHALGMSRLGLDDISHFQGYDNASMSLISQIEAVGFVETGAGLAFCKDGQLGLGGRLPANTNGGLLSEAYMHGWNHVVESVRQLRLQAGARQVPDVAASMYAMSTTESAHALVLTRAECV